MERAVIFDLDGVIIDSGAFHFQAWRELASDLGVDFNEALFKQTFGMQNPQILRLLLGREANDAKQLADRKEEYYRAAIIDKIEALPGALSLISQLRKAGWKTALGTSAPPGNVSQILTELKAYSLFDAISQSGDYDHGKPAPDVFLVAASKLGVLPKRCIVVEDAIVGVQAAKQAGMKCIAVTTTNEQSKLGEADLVVESLTEVSPENCLILLGA